MVIRRLRKGEDSACCQDNVQVEVPENFGSDPDEHLEVWAQKMKSDLVELAVS